MEAEVIHYGHQNKERRRRRRRGKRREGEMRWEEGGGRIARRGRERGGY